MRIAYPKKIPVARISKLRHRTMPSTIMPTITQKRVLNSPAVNAPKLRQRPECKESFHDTSMSGFRGLSRCSFTRALKRRARYLAQFRFRPIRTCPPRAALEIITRIWFG